MKPIVYRRSGDPVTDRIIAEFEDFAGFDEDRPPLVHDVVDTGEPFEVDTSRRSKQSGRSGAAPAEKPVATSTASRDARASRVGGAASAAAPTEQESSPVCPRCKKTLDAGQRFYGPCSNCRGQLRALKPPKPDRTHFKNATRQDGAHTVDAVTCGSAKCKRKACQQAQAESMSRARDSEGAA